MDTIDIYQSARDRDRWEFDRELDRVRQFRSNRQKKQRAGSSNDYNEPIVSEEILALEDSLSNS